MQLSLKLIIAQRKTFERHPAKFQKAKFANKDSAEITYSMDILWAPVAFPIGIEVITTAGWRESKIQDLGTGQGKREKVAACQLLSPVTRIGDIPIFVNVQAMGAGLQAVNGAVNNAFLWGELQEPHHALY